MKIRAVFSDLDGTMLEPDGSILPEAAAAVRALRSRRIPLCVVTSKTAAEIRLLRNEIGLDTPAGFENGAGVLETSGRARLHRAAVPIDTLRAVAARLREGCSAPLVTFDELSSAELTALTGLAGAHLEAARQRAATLPLVVEPDWDERLTEGLPRDPDVRLVRGNRFLHLQGRHDKSATVELLLADLPGQGVVVTCGDSPNDLGLLAAGSIAVVVPGAGGPHPELVNRLPDAMVAPRPHGAGWAAAITALLEARDQ